MKHVMITQIKNQQERIFDWLLYHYKEGIDTFIIFDDYSEDDTIKEIESFKEKYGVELQLHMTDEKGRNYTIEQSKNSETYGSDKNLNDRILRSYTRGNDIVKKINPNAFCYFFDVDEFLVSDEKYKVTEVVESLFEDGHNQLLIYNFDVAHNYNLEKGFIYQNEQYFRWDYDDVNSHKVWKTRCKCVLISKYCEKANFVHGILSDGSGTHQVRNYEKLRMLHYRIPNLPNSQTIKFVLDNSVKNKMNSYIN